MTETPRNRTLDAKAPHYRTLDANEAVADIAYRLSEVIAIYPITPASDGDGVKPAARERADGLTATIDTGHQGVTEAVLEASSHA